MSDPTLLAFFKALADGNRLRVVGLLAHRPYAVEELATVLDLRPSTVSHHLSKLTKVGLVRSRADGHYHIYELDLDALRVQAETLLSTQDLRELAPASTGLDPFDEKVLSTFLDDEGRVRQLPMKRKKFEVLLRHALRLFEGDGPWTEAHLNERLKALSDDTATFRRGFIDHGMMVRNRDGSAYRRA